MSRFSPQVLPAGPAGDPAEEILQALLLRRQQKRQDAVDARAAEEHGWRREEHVEAGVDRTRRRSAEDVTAGRETQRFEREVQGWEHQDEDRAHTRAVQTAQDADNGIFRGAPPTQARPSVAGALDAVSGVVPGLAAARGRQQPADLVPGLAAARGRGVPQESVPAEPGRYEDLGSGYYRDTTRTPEARSRGRQQSAFEVLKRHSPTAYASFVDGFDYTGELGRLLEDDRVSERQRREMSHEWGLAEMRENREDGRVRLRAALDAASYGGTDGTAGVRRPTGSITMDQAIDEVRRVYGVRDEWGEVTGLLIPEEQVVNYARRLYAGETLPPRDSVTPREPITTVLPPMRAQPPASRRPQPQPSQRQPAQSRPPERPRLSPQQIAEARSYVQGLATTDAIEDLRSTGFDEAEISQILHSETRLESPRRR